MATYYVYSGAGGTNAGTSWTNAYTSFASAVTAATTDEDVILVHYTHQEELAADTTYTFAANVNVLTVNKDSSNAPTPMGTSGWIGKSVTTSYAINLAGTANKTVAIYGLTLLNAGSTDKSITIGSGSADCSWVMDNCYLWLGSTAVNPRIRFGGVTGGTTSSFTVNNITYRFGSTSQGINPSAKFMSYGGSISTSGSAPSTVFQEYISHRAGLYANLTGFDASHSGSGTLVGSYVNIPAVYYFSNCKFGSGYVALATQTAGQAGASVYINNSGSGDNHYEFAHHDSLGSLVAVTSPYVSDGALYDGTNHVTWKIITTAAASIYRPYISPWIEKYHSGTSAITPSIEGLKINDATVAQNDEVWGEFSYQGTTGYTLSTIVDDRMALLGTAADQTSSKTYSDWTASPATDSGDSVFKLLSASITPAEIGMLMARVCVGAPSVTVYVDPKIRT